MQVDKQQARFGSTKPPRKKQSYDDHDSLRNHEGEKKMKRRKGVGGLSSKKHKASANLSNFERFENADEPTQENEDHHDAFTGKHDNWFKKPGEKKTEELPEQSWFNELVDDDKDLGENELQIGSTIMFSKNMKNFLNKDKITKADLEGPVFELLKNRLNQNNIKDLYLLKIQDKKQNIGGIGEYDLIKALRLYIRRNIIKNRVKDAQLGVESY
ncbi:hypothetical protein Tco_1153670 [Tanacetum coccineum]